jgi:hypothetical protein
LAQENFIEQGNRVLRFYLKIILNLEKNEHGVNQRIQNSNSRQHTRGFTPLGNNHTDKQQQKHGIQDNDTDFHTKAPKE